MSDKDSADKVVSVIPCTLAEGDEFSVQLHHSALEEFFVLEIISRHGDQHRHGDQQVLTDRAGLQRLADDINAFLADEEEAQCTSK